MTAKKQLMTAFCFLLERRCRHLFWATAPFSACTHTNKTKQTHTQESISPACSATSDVVSTNQTHQLDGALDLGQAEDEGGCHLVRPILLQRGGRKPTLHPVQDLVGQLLGLQLPLIRGTECDITFT